MFAGLHADLFIVSKSGTRFASEVLGSLDQKTFSILNKSKSVWSSDPVLIECWQSVAFGNMRDAVTGGWADLTLLANILPATKNFELVPVGGQVVFPKAIDKGLSFRVSGVYHTFSQVGCGSTWSLDVTGEVREDRAAFGGKQKVIPHAQVKIEKCSMDAFFEVDMALPIVLELYTDSRYRSRCIAHQIGIDRKQEDTWLFQIDSKVANIQQKEKGVSHGVAR